MTIEVNGQSHEVHKPTLRIERDVRRKWARFSELVASDDDKEFEQSLVVWDEIVQMVFVNPVSELSANNLTVGEMGDLLLSFFAFASAMKPKVG